METKNDFIITSIHFTFAVKYADMAESLLRDVRDASVNEPGGNSIPGERRYIEHSHSRTNVELTKNNLYQALRHLYSCREYAPVSALPNAHG